MSNPVGREERVEEHLQHALEKQQSEPIHFDFSGKIPVPTDPFRFNLESLLYNFGKIIASDCLDTHLLDEEVDEYVTDEKVRKYLAEHIDTLRRCHPLQKPVEWSEEDEEYFDNATHACLETFGEDSDTAYWLNSLKERLK